MFLISYGLALLIKILPKETTKDVKQVQLREDRKQKPAKWKIIHEPKITSEMEVDIAIGLIMIMIMI